MASSINFNTVWTSIFEPVPTFGFLPAARARSVWGARHDQPFHVVGSDAAGVVVRVGSAVRLWKPGDAVTVHCNHVDDQDPSGARRLDARDQPADLGLRDQLRRSRRAEPGEGEPADAQARAPHVGRSGCQRVDQLHELPHAREPERRADDPGPDGADLGRERRDRRVRVPVRAERWRHPGRRGVEPGAGRAAARARRRARDRPQGRGVPVLEGRAARRIRPSGGGSASASASSSAPIPTSCSSTPAVRRWARRCSCAPGAGPSSPARPPAGS